jgi:hypothetical protein
MREFCPQLAQRGKKYENENTSRTINRRSLRLVTSANQVTADLAWRLTATLYRF